MSTALKSQRADDCAQVELGGVPVSCLGMADTLSLLADWAGGDEPRRVATANVDFLRNASKHKGLRTALRTSDLVTADGFPLVVLSRLLGRPIMERVAGADLVPMLAPHLAERGHSVFLLGGGPGVAVQAAQRLEQLAPGLEIAGVACPFIDWSNDAEAEAVARRIRRSGADVVLVALGSPRQELFLTDWLETTGCKLGIGVGGTFDFLANPTSRAPRWIQDLGFEWAHRLFREPRRLASRYVLDAAYLAQLATLEIRASLGPRRAHAGGAA